MGMKALPSPASAFSWRLRSVCLRYGVAKPSVWPCSMVCKRLQFNHFRSDSPLNFTSWWIRFGDVGEASPVRRFLVVHSTVCGVLARALQSSTSVGCSRVCSSWRFALRWRSLSISSPSLATG